MFLDWNSQASLDASMDQAPSADLTQPGTRSSRKDPSQRHQSLGSLIWEPSESFVPHLQLPKLVDTNPSTDVHRSTSATPGSPPDMPSGPSIATARKKHPLSSIKSAALTQLRAELSALLAEAQRGPDLSLVPLPRQLGQAAAARSVTKASSTAVKNSRASSLQPRFTAAGVPLLRSNSRRRYTADAALPNANRTKVSGPDCAVSTRASQPRSSQPELCQQDITQPAMGQHVAAAPVPSAAGAHAASDGGTGHSLQPLPKPKKYGRSSSWGAGSGCSRAGVTQNGFASTSYNKYASGLVWSSCQSSFWGST